MSPTDQGELCVEMMGLDGTAEFALEDEDVCASNGTAPSGGGEFAGGEVGGGGADLGEGEYERILR